MSTHTETKVIDIAAEAAYEAGKSDAKDAIETARQSGDDAVVFITGNSYMPPLRAFGDAERFYAVADDEFGTLWDSYVEGFDTALTEADVHWGCPDYDNALYVVDLKRWQSRDEMDVTGDSLNDEWERVER